jgi:hypothetical protein
MSRTIYLTRSPRSGPRGRARAHAALRRLELFTLLHTDLGVACRPKKPHWLLSSARAADARYFKLAVL